MKKPGKYRIKSRRKYFGLDHARMLREKRVVLGCGKVCHASKGVAKASARSTVGINFHGDKPGFLEPYYCELCEYWHIGHSTKVDPKLMRSLTPPPDGAV